MDPLFIFITDYQNVSHLTKAINFVSDLSPNRSRPKVLFIFLKQTTFKSCDNLLRLMWYQDFMDATAVSIFTKKNYVNHYFSKEPQGIILRYFNPHTNVTKTINFSSSVQWFPDKARNLYGYNLTVVTSTIPPEIFSTKNKEGQQEYSGLGWLRAKSLSETMNFRIISDYHDHDHFETNGLIAHT